MDATIRTIEYLHQNKPDQRDLKITLTNGAIIRAGQCYEGWQQWGGTTSELWITQPIVTAHNDWLHGGNLPQFRAEDD